MGIKKGSKLIAATLTFFSLITLIWFSCTKVTSNPNTCIGVICQNGGRCGVDTATKKPTCVCPTGYEGISCSVASVKKYTGYWNMTQIISGSDSIGFKNDTSHFIVYLTNTATPTTFFINNFSDNPYYDQIICTLDSANSSLFSLDTISAERLLFSHYHLLYGYGYISSNDSFMRVDLATRHLSATTNWINDTMIFLMTPH